MSEDIQDRLKAYTQSIIDEFQRPAARNVFRDEDGRKIESPHVTEPHWDLEIVRIGDALLTWQMRFLPTRTDLQRVAIVLPSGRLSITLNEGRYTMRATDLILVEARLRGFLNCD